MATSDRARAQRTARSGSPAVTRHAGARVAAAPLSAYVLHHYDWSESSLIVELFTRERGRVVVAAKGAKRPSSQLRPVLLPFQRLTVHLGKAPADDAAEVHTLKSAEWAGGVPIAGGAALFAGFYLNELLLKGLARQDPHPQLFDAYAQTLAVLADEAPALRAFEIVLLRELGFLPDLAAETLTQRALEPARGYALSNDAGLLPAADGLPGRAWLELAAAVEQGSMEALRLACAPVAASLRAPLRQLLHYHLGIVALRTREVMQGVNKFAESRPNPSR